MPTPMTKQELNLVDKFYEDSDNFICTPDGEIFWEDFKEAFDYINEHKNVHCYTSVEGDNDTVWIIPGYRYVNRLGYMITKKEIDIPESGIREL